jgi:hypothetical protein
VVKVAVLLVSAFLFWHGYKVLKVEFVDRGNNTILIKVCNPTSLWVYYNDSFVQSSNTPYGTSIEYLRRLDQNSVYLRDALASRSGFTYMLSPGSLAPFYCKSREADVSRALLREEEHKPHDADNLIEKYRLEFRITGGVPKSVFYVPGHGFDSDVRVQKDGTEKKFYSPWYEYKPYKQGAP